MSQPPETQYVLLGEDRIAYQVFGGGDVDLVWFAGSGDCIDLRWDWPPYVELLDWLAARARVITFDARGLGASDPPSGEALPPWERRADDARTVLDAVGSKTAVLVGTNDSGAAAILFAATHPSRTSGLLLCNSQAGSAATLDDPGAMSKEDVTALTEFIVGGWGRPSLAEYLFPDVAKRDPSFVPWLSRMQRLGMTPTMAAREFSQPTDVRNALSSVRVPTLVLHNEEFEAIPVEYGRYLAEHIAGARFVSLPGRDSWPFVQPGGEECLRQIDSFLSSLTTAVVSNRALAAILFTDIVGSTERASALGDLEWRNLLETHDALARTLVGQYQGRIVKTTGDGVLATFDGPGRAIRCAEALGDALKPLGLEIHAGLHTGEVEIREADIAGIGVHIAARVLASASPGEVWVSAAVPMLVAGSGFEFDDRGEHDLKGVQGPWRLFSVRG